MVVLSEEEIFREFDGGRRAGVFHRAGVDYIGIIIVWVAVIIICLYDTLKESLRDAKNGKKYISNAIY